jgi:hypothetical protein
MKRPLKSSRFVFSTIPSFEPPSPCGEIRHPSIRARRGDIVAGAG